MNLPPFVAIMFRTVFLAGALVGGAVDEHGVCRYGAGHVYVMNDAGSTVGKYSLSP
jgi:hypothetical protein